MEDFIQRLGAATLYAILDTMYVAEDRLTVVALEMIEGGVDIVQLRAKNLGAERIRDLAIPLCRMLHDADIPFMINDHPAVAAEVGAAGAHVGQDDMPVAGARALAGPSAIIGKSTHSIAQAQAAMSEAPDYIGYGPLHANQTKPGYAPVGLSDIARIHELSTVPVFCIGGIKEHNLDSVVGAGARRVVIVSELLAAHDIPAYCRRIKARFDRTG